jgi:hypothetical protein
VECQIIHPFGIAIDKSIRTQTPTESYIYSTVRYINTVEVLYQYSRTYCSTTVRTVQLYCVPSGLCASGLVLARCIAVLATAVELTNAAASVICFRGFSL